MRLRGPWLINRDRLDTATASAFGTIPAGSIVTVNMDPYTFWPALQMRLTLDLFITPRLIFGIPGPGSITPDDAEFMIRNDDVVPREYGAAWRFVNP